jgi:plastocyanin domain-containing protein
VSTVTGFRNPGLYRLWVQFQRNGNVITVPFTFQVDPGKEAHRAPSAIPPDAIRVRVSQSGFEPARIAAPAGYPLKLAFQRDDAQNCVNAVVFPELGIRQALPVGEAIVVEIPSSTAREYHFVCGMNMYRGSLVIQ